MGSTDDNLALLGPNLLAIRNARRASAVLGQATGPATGGLAAKAKPEKMLLLPPDVQIAPAAPQDSSAEILNFLLQALPPAIQKTAVLRDNAIHLGGDASPITKISLTQKFGRTIVIFTRGMALPHNVSHSITADAADAGVSGLSCWVDWSNENFYPLVKHLANITLTETPRPIDAQDTKNKPASAMPQAKNEITNAFNVNADNVTVDNMILRQIFKKLPKALQQTALIENGAIHFMSGTRIAKITLIEKSGQSIILFRGLSDSEIQLPIDIIASDANVGVNKSGLSFWVNLSNPTFDALVKKLADFDYGDSSQNTKLEPEKFTHKEDNKKYLNQKPSLKKYSDVAYV